MATESAFSVLVGCIPSLWAGPLQLSCDISVRAVAFLNIAFHMGGGGRNKPSSAYLSKGRVADVKVPSVL